MKPNNFKTRKYKSILSTIRNFVESFILTYGFRLFVYIWSRQSDIIQAVNVIYKTMKYDMLSNF